jgi:flagellar motility protein MotE (MotC chaperone)
MGERLAGRTIKRISGRILGCTLGPIKSGLARRLKGLGRLEAVLFGLLVVKLALSGLWLVAGMAPQGQVVAAEAGAPLAGNASADPQLLQRQREDLNRREERLRQRESEVEALAADVEARLERLTALQQKMKEDMRLLATDKDSRKAKQVKRLVQFYANMKAEKAAALIDKLDEGVVVDVFAQMPSENAGKILSFVHPEKAARISQRLTELR